MDYTKEKWIVTKFSEKDSGVVAININNPTNHRTVAMFHQNEKDANLICSAVNACQSVNYNNPLAVAEAIKPMYEALKLALQTLDTHVFEVHPDDIAGQVIRMVIQKALNKAEEK